jgi:citronellyl-CoA synthetase
MSLTDNYMLTMPTFLGKIVKTLPYAPTIVKGVKLTKETDTTKPTGFGLLLEKAVEKNPDGVAVFFEDEQITYRDFNSWANRIAYYYVSIGLKKGDCAAIFIENSIELLAVVAGLAKIGVVSAMVNTSQKSKVLEHSINLVKPSIAIVSDKLFEAFNGSFENLNIDKEACYSVSKTSIHQRESSPGNYQQLFDLARELPDQNPQSTQEIFLKDPLFYVYTSGTTGLPKAVVFNHGRYMRGVGAFGYVCMRQTKDDVLYAPLPFYHSTGMVVCWGSALCGAGALAIREKFSASSFWDDCIKYGATSFGYVGELCRYLLNVPPSPKDRAHKVYKVIGNGLRPAVWNEFKERFGISRVHEFYASSEGNVGFTNAFNVDMTVGFTPMNWSLVKYNEETGNIIRNKDGYATEVKKGQPGLLVGFIEPQAPYDGYTDEEKTKKTILKDVFEQGDSYFNTGDVMRHIGFNHAQFVDRLGDTFRWKGENVSTTEVESSIHEHEQISDSVVYGVEIPNTNGRAGMAAIFMKDQNEDLDVDVLLEKLQEQLPSYAVPVFLRVSKSHIDTTGTFKYKKSDLKKDAFYLEKCGKDKLFVLLPGEKKYSSITESTLENINAGQYRF